MAESLGQAGSVHLNSCATGLLRHGVRLAMTNEGIPVGSCPLPYCAHRLPTLVSGPVCSKQRCKLTYIIVKTLKESFHALGHLAGSRTDFR